LLSNGSTCTAYAEATRAESGGVAAKFAAAAKEAAVEAEMVTGLKPKKIGGRGRGRGGGNPNSRLFGGRGSSAGKRIQ
jgi:hypothetical protein